MPVWNGASTLERALASLVGQRDDLFELIAVDQASRDGSRDILADFATRLPLTIIDAPESKSWMTNTNIGIRAATGRLVTFLHQDDAWLPHRAERLCELSERFPEAELLVHPALLIDDRDRRLGSMAPPFGSRTRLVSSAEALDSLIIQNTIALPGAAFRRSTALSVGCLSETLWYTADWDLWLKLASRGPVAWTPEPLAAFRIHVGSQTVRRSADLEEFGSQLSVPVVAHIGAVSPARAREALACASASNMLNVFLAGRYHGVDVSIRPFLGVFLRLGPRGWIRFLKHTRILRRLVPRLRLLMK